MILGCLSSMIATSRVPFNNCCYWKYIQLCENHKMNWNLTLCECSLWSADSVVTLLPIHSPKIAALWLRAHHKKWDSTFVEVFMNSLDFDLSSASCSEHLILVWNCSTLHANIEVQAWYSFLGIYNIFHLPFNICM